MQTTAKTAEDLIGIIPHTLGYAPRESLVVIIVGTDEHGAQTCDTTLRVDFDLETAAHVVREGGRWFSRLITGACVATGVFLVLYDEEYLTGGPTPRLDVVKERTGLPAGECPDRLDGDDGNDLQVRRGLVRAAIDEIALSLEEHGIDTLSAWWVSRDRFGRIDDDGAASTPLEAASTSACATEFVAAGSSPAADPQELVVRPPSAAEFAIAREGRGDEWLDIEDSFDILSALYPRLARLCFGEALIDRAVLSELMTLQTVMAVDAMLAEKWSRDALEMILSFSHPNFRPKDIKKCRSGDLYNRAKKYAKSPRAAQSMVGLSPYPPRPRDVQVGIEFLETYIPLGHPNVRATAYAVIAWFEWSLGGSTMAEQYAQAGLALQADNSMAMLILEAVELGYLPQWLMSARSNAE